MWCDKHDRVMECFAGCSAHSSNWYCPECDKDERIAELESELKDLQDMLHNGIKYDEKQNRYFVCWTQRELDQARKKADELMKYFKALPGALEEK